MISDKIRKLREERKFTQQQIADSLNIDRSTYAYYELGKTKPDVYTVMKLSKIFNVSYADILSDEREDNLNLSDNSENLKLIKGISTTISEKMKYSPIYSLTKKEQQMIVNYRMLPYKKQDEIFDEILKEINNGKK